jgi:hypothetical protein
MIFTVLIAPIARAQVLSVPDLKSLDGTWRGTQTDQWGLGTVEWVITSGRVQANVTHPFPAHRNGGYRATGTLLVTDGRITWTASTSSGEVTLHEVEGKRVLRYEILGRQSAKPVTGEVIEVKKVD